MIFVMNMTIFTNSPQNEAQSSTAILSKSIGYKNVHGTVFPYVGCKEMPFGGDDFELWRLYWQTMQQTHKETNERMKQTMIVVVQASLGVAG